ncbi:hypothetical protein CU098_005577 [Rhizopus stolonifer]|uniref:Uncharacterized protein n=1 Tax=Rhizopus stolonifer TaxID=4846 RepID=A0A367IYK3_RHIST|nr:hypothetical protein CU098_005577 [Rhizopus stolonifer]
MENIANIFQQTGTAVGDTRHRLLRHTTQSTNTTFHQLEMGPASHHYERIFDTMEPMETGLSVSTMAPHTSLFTTPTTVSHISNDHHSGLTERRLVSLPPVTSHISTITSTTTDDSSSQFRGRICHDEERPMATFGLEHKKQRLQQHGFDDNALNVFLDPALQPSAENRSHIQKRFISWCNQHELNYTLPNPTQIVNFIAYGHQFLQWQPSTCNTYRSSILDLYPDHRDQILADHDFHQFFSLLTSSQIRSFNRPVFDLTPVVDKLHEWGRNSHINNTDLTRKLCFLLAITGFLRPSDIQRIDDSLTSFNSDHTTLTLVIDCPKEKRQGQRIQRQVHIRHHPDLRLCPIQAYSSYKSRIASSPLVIAHPTQPQRQIHCLVSQIYNHHQPIVSQTIGKHNNHFINLIALPGGTPRPRACALGSTNAAINGLPIDDILTHGSWASSSVYDTFYRLSRSTASDFTRFVFNSATHSSERSSEDTAQVSLQTTYNDLNSSGEALELIFKRLSSIVLFSC